MKILKFLSMKLKLCCVAVIAVAIAGAGLASVWPVMLSDIYDAISTGAIDSVHSGAKAFLVFGGVFAAAELCSTARRIWVENISAALEKELRNKSIKKLMRLPTHFYNSNTSGEYTAKINRSVSGANQVVKAICNNIVPSVFMGFFTIYQIIRKAPVTIALILASYIVIEIFVSSLQVKSQNGIRETLVAKKAKLDGTVCQSIQNIEMIRVTNAEDYEYGRIHPITEDICATECRHHTYMGSFDFIKHLMKVIYTVLLLFVAVWLVGENRMAEGMVITVILLFQQLTGPVDALHAFMDEMAGGAVKAREVTKLLAQAEDGIFCDSLEDGVFPDGDITVKNFTVYTPDGSRAICENRSFTVKSGSVTALKGPTGCGKSSFIKGFMRFYSACGEVKAGGQSIKHLSQHSLCKGVYDMVQQPVFFTGTLKENLVYGLDYTPSDDQLIFALKNAMLYSELREKTEKVLNIRIAENGANLSGGQRQRLAVARAFLRQPKWFFVDEATANIDDATTEKVFANLKNYAKSIGASLLCVSHQQIVTAACDEIIEFSA